jgi:hypothetical protein
MPKTPGDDLTNRLMSRASGGGAVEGLTRRGMVDGGSVYSGPLARKALRSLGARAFTVDENIVVDPTFDASNPKDAALYAHERHHQSRSGGKGGSSAGNHDSEEQQAIAIEEMVLHRMEMGENIAKVMHDVTTGTAIGDAKGSVEHGGAKPGSDMITRAIRGGDKDRDQMEAYWHMRNEGRHHKDIVDELKQHCMWNIQRLNEEHAWRSGGEGDFMGGPA